MLTVVIGLVCFAIAFVSGGMLSKAYFATRGAPGSVGRNKLHALLQAQRVRYRKRLVALNNVILRHEETRDKIRTKLTNIEHNHSERGKMLIEAKTQLEQHHKQNQNLRQQLAARDRRIAELDNDNSGVSDAEKELGMLRIERDELAARITRMEADQAENPDSADSHDDENEIARMRSDMGEIRETLATRDRRVHDLELQLNDSIDRARQLQAKLDSWKQRVSPLTRKLKKQKEVIRKLCESTTEGEQAERPAPEPCDDLKMIRGIGPALERRLHQHGIRYYRQLAEMTAEQLTDITQKLSIAPNLAERDEWIEQARDLLAQAEPCETA